MSKKHPKPIPPITSSECSPYVSIPIEFVGRVVSVKPICAGSYSLTVGRDTHLSLPGVAPDWMVPGVYVRVLFNQPDGTDRIELLGKAESEHFANLEAQHANQNPFAAHNGTT